MNKCEKPINKEFEKINVNTEELFNDLLKELKEQTIFSVDTETTSLSPIDTDLVGISIAYNPQITY